MKLFDRFKKSDKKNLPPEVEKYYKSERRERVWMAWLIAFLALVLTVAVIVGLFYLGRWAYREIAGTNEPTQTVSQPSGMNEPQGSNNSDNNVPSESSQTPENNLAGSNGTNTTPSNEEQSTQESGNLSNTGPGNLLSIFLATSIIGALAHSFYLKSRTSEN